jgi:hypothetical protein
MIFGFEILSAMDKQRKKEATWINPDGSSQETLWEKVP